MSDVLPITPGRLLEETEWLQSLARHLAGPDDADDLAQTAWLRALERQPDRIRGLRPWLRTVLRHAFLRGRRDRVARLRREMAAARREAVPSTAALAARASLHGAVVEAVLALDEPGRSTVLLRFFDDRKPEEIARLHGIAVTTVHTRLRRAFAELRTKLDRGQGGRDAWVVLAAPAVSDDALLAAPSAAAAGSGAAGHVALMGVLLMSFKTKVGIAVGCGLLLAIGTATIWRARSDREGPPAYRSLVVREDPTAASAPSTTVPATRMTPRPFGPDAGQAPPAAQEPQGPGPGKARIEIPIIRADQSPVVDKAIDLVISMGAAPEANDEAQLAMSMEDPEKLAKLGVALAEVRSGPTGMVSVDVISETPGRVRVRVTPAGRRITFLKPVEWLAVMPFEAIRQGDTSRLPPVVIRSLPLLVAGRVEDALGEPVEGVSVLALRVGRLDASELKQPTDGLGDKTGRDGRFRIESEAASGAFAAWAHVDRELASALVPFRRGESDLLLRILAVGGIEGRIRAAPHLGEVTPNLVLKPQGVALGAPIPAFCSPEPRPHVDKTGRFVHKSVPAGTYSLVITVGIAEASIIPDVVIEPGKTNADPRFADLVVGDQMQRAVVRVLSGDGDPLRGAMVRWRPGEGSTIQMTNTSYTDGAGEATLSLPLEAVMTIEVEMRGFRPWIGKDVALPLTVRLDRGASAVVRLPGARELPLPQGVNRYALCLIPDNDVAAAARESRNVIPSRVHESQAQWVEGQADVYRFNGMAEGNYVAFIVPVRFQAGRSIQAGPHLLFDAAVRSLDLGRLEVKAGRDNDVTYRVNTDQLVGLILR